VIIGPTRPRYWWNVVPSSAWASCVAAPCQVPVSALPKPPRISLGHQPTEMNRVVMMPQARKAGRLGMMMLLAKAPNRWSAT
jgi:hypothetical protein